MSADEPIRATKSRRDPCSRTNDMLEPNRCTGCGVALIKPEPPRDSGWKIGGVSPQCGLLYIGGGNAGAESLPGVPRGAEGEIPCLSAGYRLSTDSTLG